MIDEKEYQLENIDIQDIEDTSAEEHTKMDFSLQDPAERISLVEEIIKQTPPRKLTNLYLEKLADYILDAITKQEKRDKKILTDNRMVTVNKRETSLEGLAGKLENGEDGIYNMITNDKNVILTPKISITERDIAEIPGLKELRDEIERIEKQAAAASGKKAYLLKKQAIEMRQDQYVIKNAYRKPIYCMNLIKSLNKIDLSEKITVNERGDVSSTGIINLFDEKHISILLCNYVKIKENCWADFNGDIMWLMMDLDKSIDNALKEKYPLYYDLLIYKIDGKQNQEIQELLEKKHGIKHTVEYISCLWRNKIPKIIADYNQEDWLLWHYTVEEKGKWKKCSRCGQIKLAHNRFFSKNKTSKDNFYSICKECRNKKK